MKYLKNSLCYVADNNTEVVGVCVLNARDGNNIELFNSAVSPEVQGLGVGKVSAQGYA
ncbi:GNAT family N-acetyltransferase [Photobacterium chitinilyticum]|uniref:N-acetyltransferase n=1 Tax=Photobacterium chitinilyticum TaxID=2485123 RepID=A0A3S4TPZ3_9GAMM|nr:N-acetyltransferase [Photobacterium chitinilyticum]